MAFVHRQRWPWHPVKRRCCVRRRLCAGWIALPIDVAASTLVVPGASRLYQDFCAQADAAHGFYRAEAVTRPARPLHLAAMAEELARQNPGAAEAVNAYRNGAGVVVTGQQVGLFGGTLYVPLKAATALAEARRLTAAGTEHVALFWLATEDHDFDEIAHVVFPERRSLRRLDYAPRPTAAVPVGGVKLTEAIVPLLEQAGELIGYSDALDALEANYKPGRTLAEAFAGFYASVFGGQMLLLDPSGRAVHALGAPVLRAALERSDELHVALVERNEALVQAGYHAQVAVTAQSSLLFLMDAETGERQALKRTPSTASEPQGVWQAGRVRYSTDELLAILAEAPERLSPTALLRPVFQDHLLGTTATVGGPAEIAYFAQSAVLFEKIAGRVTASLPRAGATLIEPTLAELLRKHELDVARLFGQDVAGLTRHLSARAMPIEGKRKLAAAGLALEAELEPLLKWMHAVDGGLGHSAERAASKMRYQMNRLRYLAANFERIKEPALGRHAEALINGLTPGGVPQERVHGAAWYLGRHGMDLFAKMAAEAQPGVHRLMWL